MANRNWGKILEPDPAYPCVATSIEGLVQQVSVCHLREGYTNFVTGVIPDRADPAKVDRDIVTRYGLNKDWRYRASLKQNPQGAIANVEYIRFGRFYVIQATGGEHLFYEREAARIRSCLRNRQRTVQYPFSEILVPVNLREQFPDDDQRTKATRSTGVHGYAIFRQKGCYKRKTSEQRSEFRQALQEWQQRTALGEKLPKPRPGFGQRDDRFRSIVKLDRRAEGRHKDSFLNLALARSHSSLEYEFRSTGFVPFAEVKNQLLQILKAVNSQRRTAGGRKQELSYNTILHLKRWQIHPFEPVDFDCPRFRDKYPSLWQMRDPKDSSPHEASAKPCESRGEEQGRSDRGGVDDATISNA